MNCPACGRSMKKVKVTDVTVDVCDGGCGGLWFDQFELRKFDEPHEEGGEPLLLVERNPSVSVDRTEKLRCPKCPDSVMMRHFFSSKRQVEVDECPTCAAFWLDVGELAQIRTLFPSDEARRQAAREYMKEVLGGELAAHRSEREAKTQKFRRLARIFRFICPSSYLPGDQDWGAF